MHHCLQDPNEQDFPHSDRSSGNGQSVVSCLSCTDQDSRMGRLLQGLSSPTSSGDKVAALLELNTLRGVTCRSVDRLKAQHLQVWSCPSCGNRPAECISMGSMERGQIRNGMERTEGGLPSCIGWLCMLCKQSQRGASLHLSFAHPTAGPFCMH